MRKMEKDGIVINVVQHIIIKNFWEYYITDEETNDKDLRFGLVMGYETELGYIYMPEIAPFVITKTKKLDEIMAASGWKWSDKDEES
jgi:hypothetical protein